MLLTVNLYWAIYTEGWNLWRQPIGFLVFLMSSLAECERLPFDLLVAGYQIEYSSIKYGFFYLASYLSLLVYSLFVKVLYLGEWNFFIPYISLTDNFSPRTYSPP